MLHYPKMLILLASLLFWACHKKQSLFTRLPAAETGIDFANNILETDSLNVFSFEYIYNGGGVGVGDFNNDGLQDVYFAGNEVSSRLYLNRGSLHFEDITAIAHTGTRYWCTGVAIIDINADGWKDIYLSTAFPDATKPAPNLLFVNQGLNKDGIPVFKEAAALAGLNDSAYATQAAFLDYDRDGDLDVYLCINSRKEQDRNELRIPRADGTGPSQDRLLRNDGTASPGALPRYTDVSRQAGIQAEGWGLGVVVKDLNRDGWPDIYVANDFQSNDHLYINNQDGTFTNKIAQYLAHQSHNSMGVDIADCNNDGLEDICVVDMLPEDNLRQKTMFDAIPNDKYAAALRLGYQPQFVRNMLQLNNGSLPDSSGTVAFSDIGYMAGVAATDWSWSPLWADVDGDGWRDLLITNGYVKDITDLDFSVYASEYRMFGSQEAKWKLLQQKAKEIGEVKKKNWLFHNNADLTFSNRADDWGLGETSFSNGAAYADLDNDGDLDLLMNNLNGEAFVYRNNSRQLSPQDHYLQVKLEGAGGNIQGIGAKLHIWYEGRQQYAEQALQRGYLSSVDERLFFGLGGATKIDSLQVEWLSGKTQKLYAVLPNQTLVLREANAKTKTPAPLPPAAYWLQATSLNLDTSYRHEENDYLDFLYQYTLPHRYSMQGPSLAVGDINGDGLEDVYTGGASRHSGHFLVQRPGGFQVKALTQTPQQKRQEETGTLLFDADRDGDEDLYCVGGGNEFGDSSAYADLLLLNDGRGNFTDASAALPNTTASGSCISAVDFDHDGDLDLFVGGRSKPHRYPLPDRSYLLRNDTDPQSRAVRFTDVTAQLAPGLMAPGMVAAALWTDYDNDSYPDLMLAGEFMPILLFKNNQGKGLSPVRSEGFAYTNGWYNSLTGADFDNDGDIDYVAGNLGLNSRYRCSEKEPISVRYHDFNRDGAPDAFLFGYLNGREYPLHTRATMLEQIPSLKKKAFYYHQFGKMSYANLFSSEERRGAKELKAYQMASLYIENKGKNGFAVKPLPLMVQVAPLMGVLPLDVDGDGNLDMVAIGNSYAPDALSGRYDAAIGWVLKGDGMGGFKTIRPQVSGFAIRGDGRALVRLKKADNSCLLLASENSGPISAYRLQGVQSCIALRKEATYALYTLQNGKKRKEEFYKGSSYLSQQGRFITISRAIKRVDFFSSTGRRAATEYNF